MTDSPTGERRFDPRFNPAFQPGYNPQEHNISERVDQGVQPAPPGSSRVRSVDSPVAIYPPSAPSAPAAPYQPRATEIPDDLDATRTNDPESGLDAEYDRDAGAIGMLRRLDPYLIGLWLISIVLIVAGIVLVRYIEESLTRLNAIGGGSSSGYYILQVYTIAAPLLIILGLATAVGTVFLLAGRRRR